MLVETSGNELTTHASTLGNQGLSRSEQKSLHLCKTQIIIKTCLGAPKRSELLQNLITPGIGEAG